MAIFELFTSQELQFLFGSSVFHVATDEQTGIDSQIEWINQPDLLYKYMERDIFVIMQVLLKYDRLIFMRNCIGFDI